MTNCRIKNHIAKLSYLTAENVLSQIDLFLETKEAGDRAVFLKCRFAKGEPIVSVTDCNSGYPQIYATFYSKRENFSYADYEKLCIELTASLIKRKDSCISGINTSSGEAFDFTIKNLGNSKFRYLNIQLMDDWTGKIGGEIKKAIQEKPRDLRSNRVSNYVGENLDRNKMLLNNYSTEWLAYLCEKVDRSKLIDFLANNLTVGQISDIMENESTRKIILGENEKIEVGVSTGQDRSTIALQEVDGKVDITSGLTLFKDEEIMRRFLPFEVSNIPDFGSTERGLLDNVINTIVEGNDVYALPRKKKDKPLYTLSPAGVQLRKYEMLIMSYQHELMRDCDDNVLHYLEHLVNYAKVCECNGMSFDLDENIDALITAYYYLVKQGYKYKNPYTNLMTVSYYPETNHEKITEKIKELKNRK